MTQTSTAPSPPVVNGQRPPVPRWAIHRRMYDWVLAWAHSKHSTTALFILSFTESSFFPIPPDVLQIALTIERRHRAWLYAAVSTIASVFGAILGYLIGHQLWAQLAPWFYHYVPGFTEAKFEMVSDLYAKWNFWIVFVAAFTPIPFKIITIAGGVCAVNLPMFIIASFIGRGMRFFLVGALLYIFGPPIKQFIDRYFNLLSIAFALLLVGGFIVIKSFSGH